MDKDDLKTLSWVFGVVLIIAFKLGIGTSIKIHAQNIMHSGWDDAKDELRSEWLSILKETKIPAEVIKPFLACVVPKEIDFLNHTVCSYKYNTTFTKKEEHLASQKACLAMANYASIKEQLMTECIKIAVTETVADANIKKVKEGD